MYGTSAFFLLIALINGDGGGGIPFMKSEQEEGTKSLESQRLQHSLVFEACIGIVYAIL